MGKGKSKIYFCPITAHLKPGSYEAVKMLANQKQITVSEFIRRAIEEYKKKCAK